MLYGPTQQFRYGQACGGGVVKRYGEEIFRSVRRIADAITQCPFFRFHQGNSMDSRIAESGLLRQRSRRRICFSRLFSSALTSQGMSSISTTMVINAGRVRHAFNELIERTHFHRHNFCRRDLKKCRCRLRNFFLISVFLRQKRLTYPSCFAARRTFSFVARASRFIPEGEGCRGD